MVLLYGAKKAHRLHYISAHMMREQACLQMQLYKLDDHLHSQPAGSQDTFIQGRANVGAFKPKSAFSEHFPQLSKQDDRTVMACPPGSLHLIGAKMVSAGCRGQRQAWTAL